jgi:SAM-dependent methyltransferase
VTSASQHPYQLEIAAQLYDDLMRELREDIDLYVSLAQEAGGPVLELGCGTGRCMIPLTRAGFDVVGLDVSKPMLSKLELNLRAELDEHRHRAMPVYEDGRYFSLPLRFGMAFTSINSFTHLPTKQDQELFVSNIYDHLRAGGIIVIDVFNPKVERLMQHETSVRVAGEYEVIDEQEPADVAAQTRTVITSYHLRGTVLARVEWKQRYSFRFELEHLLEKAGFAILHFWGDYRRTAFGDATDRLFVVARKPQDDEDSRATHAQAVVVETA